eukprot:4928416-Alexandrium_andersonii.AAC.1
MHGTAAAQGSVWGRGALVHRTPDPAWRQPMGGPSVPWGAAGLTSPVCFGPLPGPGDCCACLCAYTGWVSGGG